MKSVLIANKTFSEAYKIKEVVSQEFNVFIITSPTELDDQLEKSDLVLLDHNFTEYSGIDFLMEILKNSYIPVLVITPPDDAQCAIKAMRVGAFNYLIKTANYHQVLNLSIKEAINKSNEREEMKQTIILLKKRVHELEERLSIAGKEDVQRSSAKTKVNIVEDLISCFKRGEINLPALPQIHTKFREMVNKDTTLQEIANLLKQDVAVSSKLISVSNSAYYQGMVENKNLEQAISRLGLNITRQYVDIICNRSLYTTTNRKYVEIMEKLWEHSISCAYASQIVSKTLKMKIQDDVFTMGLFHDIGKLVLLMIIAELELRGNFEEEVDMLELLSTLDTHHNKFGAALLKRWQFSSGYDQIAMYHNNLKEADFITKELLIIHFANLLVKSMGYDQTEQAEIKIEDTESARLLRLNSSMIPEIKYKIKGRMEELRAIFA